MQIINCSRISDFNGSTRKYYNVHDIRILDVLAYEKEERWHKHTSVTEVLFILTGKIRVSIRDESEEIKITESKDIKADEIVVFTPNEYHRIEPLTKTARILAIKYIRKEDDLMDLISSDWSE